MKNKKLKIASQASSLNQKIFYKTSGKNSPKEEVNSN